MPKLKFFYLMKLKIGKTQAILEKNSILLNKVKEFSLKLKDFDKNSTKFLKKLELFPQKLKVLPSRLGFYCRKMSKKKPAFCFPSIPLPKGIGSSWSSVRMKRKIPFCILRYHLSRLVQRIGSYLETTAKPSTEI